MPDFVKDSIVWTHKNFTEDLLSIFNWYESITIGSLYISHANPYEYGNWGYLNSEVECIDAAEALKLSGFNMGVFGHTHRRKSVFVKNNKVIEADGCGFEYKSDREAVLILNSGSVGQPRGAGASFLIFELTDENIEYALVEIKPDLEEHINAIRCSDLPESSKGKIISFFEES